MVIFQLGTLESANARVTARYAVYPLSNKNLVYFALRIVSARAPVKFKVIERGSNCDNTDD